jgi:hypothetical protein
VVAIPAAYWSSNVKSCYACCESFLRRCDTSSESEAVARTPTSALSPRAAPPANVLKDWAPLALLLIDNVKVETSGDRSSAK